MAAAALHTRFHSGGSPLSSSPEYLKSVSCELCVMHLLYIDMVVTEAQTTTDEDCLLKNGQKLEEHVEDYLLLQQAALGMMRS
ncbi:hypothetical protein ROHU_005871 [Labeo rohita]|uniref:Uncharacterized protein n=1 Tax=Labeo rohita TaxID=84645 RepID=A0A498N1H0_LABRO|nr:hypothetical protein ROHU_005871 [Labeo rohita]